MLIKIFGLKKPKGVRWIFKCISYLMVPIAVLFKSADAIPVYRDLRITQTFKKSIEALNEGCNIVIFPEKPPCWLSSGTADCRPDRPKRGSRPDHAYHPADTLSRRADRRSSAGR